MRQTWRNLVIVAAAITVALFALWKNEFRLGKDLAGGVSIVYSVTMGPNDDPREVLPRLIDVVKRRVDPNGLMDLTIVAQGKDRIEISLPASSEQVKTRKRAFEEELARLGRATLNEGRIDALVRAPEGDRARMLEELAVGSARRRELLEACVRAWDAARAKRAEYDAQTDPATKEALVPEVASAETAYERARAEAVRGTVSADEIREIVRASTRSRVVSDRTGSEVLPSQRELALERVKKNHPGMEADIDRLVRMHDEIYAGQRQTLDDPQELLRLLRGSGVLSFRITVRPGEFPGEEQARQELRERGPKNVAIPGVKWCRINDIQQWINTPAQAKAFREDPNYGVALFSGMGYVAEPYAGDYYMLCYDTRQTRLTPAEGTWAVSSARPGVDSYGRAAIDFRMNPSGAILLGNLTQAHVGNQMAILLDDEVYTAPTLQSAISSSGQITGSFSDEEIQYIVRVLSGGSLQAKLSPEPLSINAVGPELGLDNLRMGLKAGLWSIAVVAAFMVVYYFTCGAIAVVALLVNSLLILGAMALSQAAFTMPGIAGIILTFGMAVDSNVLIYERIREELGRGMDLKTAVRLGFERALASIVDGNITNLIVCVVLYYLGTTEIRGFAITMGIGVVSTLFAALVVSRVIFDIGLSLGWRHTSMLPMAIPSLQRLLTPSVDWIRLRWVFFTISAIYVSLGLGMVYFRGAKMLDNEFLGGTQVTLQLRPIEGGKHLTLKRPEVEARVREIASNLPPDNPLGKRLKNAEVFPIEPEADGITSHRFVVKTRPSDEELESAGVQAEENREMVRLLLERFADVIETQPALEFIGSRETRAARAPAYPIDKPLLGANIGRPEITWDCREYLGGVAIVVERIDPPQPLSLIVDRLHRTRQSAEFSATLSRNTRVLLLSGTEESATGVVLLSKDEEATLFQSEARWEREVRDREWALVRMALAEESTPASVQTFSASIAGTFRANAIAATLVSFILIGIYIWVRFKTPRYSIAAVVALVHDVLTVIGLLALCEILYESKVTHGFAVALGLLPFKIDLNAVAALLTIAGYSLNDTVVVMDRIRENRGKLPHATASIINLSVNQTFSRTIITGGTTIISCLILYTVGGEGMRAFAFTLFTGLVVGTYSSVAVAAPIVWDRKFEREFAALGGLVPQTA
jgi:SecD/SecF fusion protein